ncbi:MAG: chemotaxis protein CheD [Lachnospiraceae bacterium]|jgi:chemotaxis protein CheD|nr:chemotaxis protein CheD [Lachnospiraceae bacterium]MCX4316196.1 chemotaxis protein CheD [Lachnospiraceae bacterium]
MGKMITVGMADLKVCRAPDNLTTLGLGSCVGVALYDPATMVSGMLHCMLPDSTRITNQQNIAKFADTGLDELVKQMMSIGAMRSRLVAKIAGGAQMFAFSSGNDMMRVGDRNVEAVKAKLMQMRIRILAEDTGKNYGRTIEFYSETGKLLIKSVGKEKKYI